MKRALQFLIYTMVVRFLETHFKSMLKKSVKTLCIIGIKNKRFDTGHNSKLDYDLKFLSISLQKWNLTLFEVSSLIKWYIIKNSLQFILNIFYIKQTKKIKIFRREDKLAFETNGDILYTTYKNNFRTKVYAYIIHDLFRHVNASVTMK